jgi:riboflavin synthase
VFTGLIEEVGVVARIESSSGARRLWIEAPLVSTDAAAGDSIAINGCCLTVTARDGARLAFDAVAETLARTTIGGWAEGERVNLERALTLDKRLGGHLVQGHVDGVGEVAEVASESAGRRVRFTAPAALARFIAEKGSIAVDGTSLTIAACDGARFDVAYIPHTLAVTIASAYAPGRRVHLEADLVARYLARLIEAGPNGERNP